MAKRDLIDPELRAAEESAKAALLAWENSAPPRAAWLSEREVFIAGYAACAAALRASPMRDAEPTRKVWVVERSFAGLEFEPYIAELRSVDAANYKAKVWGEGPGAIANYRVVTYVPVDALLALRADAARGSEPK